jgi:hypothetical protein
MNDLRWKNTRVDGGSETINSFVMTRVTQGFGSELNT